MKFRKLTPANKLASMRMFLECFGLTLVVLVHNFEPVSEVNDREREPIIDWGIAVRHGHREDYASDFVGVEISEAVSFKKKTT